LRATPGRQIVAKGTYPIGTFQWVLPFSARSEDFLFLEFRPVIDGGEAHWELDEHLEYRENVFSATSWTAVYAPAERQKKA